MIVKKDHHGISTKYLKSYQSKPFRYMNNIRDLTSKGLYETLLLVGDNKAIRHSTLSEYVISNGISSESYFSRNLALLDKMNLVKREIVDEKPAGTSYSITNKGSETIRKIEALASHLFSE